MENIKQGVQAATEKVKEVGSKASFEGNKTVAKDSNQDLGTRASAAVNAVGDKISEVGHASNKEAHKQAAIH